MVKDLGMMARDCFWYVTVRTIVEALSEDDIV